MKMRVEAEREICQARIIRVVAKDLVLPNGRRTTFTIVEHPGAVAIVPVHANGDVVLLKQFRPSIDEELYEIPAGTMEKGEAPLATAKREIIEEMVNLLCQAYQIENRDGILKAVLGREEKMSTGIGCGGRGIIIDCWNYCRTVSGAESFAVAAGGSAEKGIGRWSTIYWDRHTHRSSTTAGARR